MPYAEALTRTPILNVDATPILSAVKHCGGPNGNI